MPEVPTLGGAEARNGGTSRNPSQPGHRTRIMTTMTKQGIVLVLSAITLSGCATSTTPLVPATTNNACTEPNATAVRILQAVQAMPTDDPNRASNIAIAAQVLVAHPACFDSETVARATQWLTEYNTPQQQPDRPSFFDGLGTSE